MRTEARHTVARRGGGDRPWHRDGRDRWSRRLGEARRGERGAVAVFTAVTIVVLMGIAAVVVDLGMERVTRRDLQALADIVALDLAREIQGRTQAELEAQGSLANPASAVYKSVNRNDDLLGENLQMVVDWGSYEGGVWNTATDPPTAVKVTATASTDYSISDGSGTVTRTAYAVASSSACYRLGTFVAAVNSNDSTVLSPLNQLFAVSLDLVSYKALAAARVRLSELAAAPTIGSPTQLLSGSITYANLISALIHVLNNQPGSSNSVAVTALGKILNVSAAVGAINLGSVLHVSPTDRAALEMQLNVLDIVGSARLATGNYFLEVPNLNANVPGVGSQFTGGLTLVSAAQLACGKPNSPESVARTAQLAGSLGIEFVNLPSLSIPGFGTLLTEKGVGTLSANFADGTGRLVSPPAVRCGSGTAGDPHTYSVAVQTALASYSLLSNLVISGDVKILDLTGIGLTNLLVSLGLPVVGTGKLHIRVDVDLTVSTGAPAGSSTANLSLPPNDVTPVQTGSSATLNPSSIVPTVVSVTIEGKSAPVASASALTSKIVTELMNATNGFVDKTLHPLIDNLNNAYIGPVARMVGLRVGGADVYAVGATCGQPSLWG